MYALKEKLVWVCNRTTRMLEVMHDGVVWTIRPGYCKNDAGEIVGADENGNPSHNGHVFLEPLPYFAAERAMRQNPVMGTADPLDPRAFVSLIGVPAWGNDYSHIEQSDALELLDASLLDVQIGQNGREMVRRAINGPRGAHRVTAPGRDKSKLPPIRLKGTILDDGFHGTLGYNNPLPVGNAGDAL